MQVACTINYGRKPLWKKWKKFDSCRYFRITAGVILSGAGFQAERRISRPTEPNGSHWKASRHRDCVDYLPSVGENN